MTVGLEGSVTSWRMPRDRSVDEQDRWTGSPSAPDASEALERGAPTPSIRILAARSSTAQEYVADAYEHHQREIYSFALHATRSVEAAEDVTQETFVRLLREAREHPGPDNVRAWLYRVAGNIVISRGRRQSVALRWLGALLRPEVTDVSPERVAVDRERHDALQAALARLPDDARVGLLMAAQGFSGREVAESIGRTEQATRTMLCRARLQVRQLLDPPDDR
jgi:RNA polymerase sigma-70 factor (ECF subfamily)